MVLSFAMELDCGDRVAVKGELGTSNECKTTSNVDIVKRRLRS
jgi:hypothetical protein